MPDDQRLSPAHPVRYRILFPDGDIRICCIKRTGKDYIIILEEGKDICGNAIFSKSIYHTEQLSFSEAADGVHIAIHGAPCALTILSSPEFEEAHPALSALPSDTACSQAVLDRNPDICFYCAFLQRPHRGKCTRQDALCARRLQMRTASSDEDDF